MTIRVAKKGLRVGSKFWGCTGYPDCHGIVNVDDYPIPSNSINPIISTEKKEALNLEPIQPEENQGFKPQVEIYLESELKTKQVRFFQTVAAYRSLVETLNLNKSKVDRESILGYSQWRLDYPKYTEKLSQKVASTIATLEKILLRGSIIPPTPLVEKYLCNETETKLSADLLLHFFRMGSILFRTSYFPKCFDSKAEEAFYQKLASNRLIRPWLSSQIPLSSLTLSAADPASKQRVDFLLSRPGNKSIVIEIDGPQHAQQITADKERDRLLEETGFAVVRIAADKVQTLDFNRHPVFSKFNINEFPDFDRAKFADDDSKPYLSGDNIWLVQIRVISQLQIAIVEAVKTGRLELSSSSHWNICVNKRKWWVSDDNLGSMEGEVNDDCRWQTAVELAIQDIKNLLVKIFYFQNHESMEIETNISFNIPNSTADVIIDFIGSHVEEVNTSNTFTISDCYLPFEIAQPIPECDPIVVNHPDEQIAEYFLKYLFGKEKFKEKQWEAISNIVSAKDGILLLPTGHGKSFVFQLASFLLPGICLVIDPLISLIDDQIDNLGKHGIDRVVGITSMLSQLDRGFATDSFSKAHYHFCYMSPERFQIKEFRDSLSALVATRPISVIVIDEAHCVSEWGHNFRVSYLNIARNARAYTTRDGFTPPILAMTGTASRSVLRDMRRELDIQGENSLISLENFDRPKLNYKIFTCPTSEKFDVLEKLLREIPDHFKDSESFFDLKGKLTNAGLIFLPHVNGKLGVGTTFTFLNKNMFKGQIGLFSGEPPNTYQGADWVKRKQHEAHSFKINKKNILVCTNSFGMGIDKENIRYTIHMNLPPSIEAAYQEAGRAGRDGEVAWCYFLVSPDNLSRINKLLDPNTTLDDVGKTMSRINFDDDDITRQIYFHMDSFRGVDEEIEVVKRFLDDFGDLRKKSNFQFTFNDDNKIITEKAIHRLLTVGVLEDYEIDYAHNTISLRLSGSSPVQNLESYLHYVENYDSKMASQERKEALKLITYPHKLFVVHLLERLVNVFIYGVIEQSRRRSLSEMLRACQGNVTNDSFRQRILSYFNLSHYSSFVEKSAENFEYLNTHLATIVDEISVPIESAELRGQVSRQLEAYPKNPPLLFLRSLSEAFCSDRNKDVVFENYLAFINFSEAVWGLNLEEIMTQTTRFINTISEYDSRLAEELVVATLERFPNESLVTWSILSSCAPELTTFIVNEDLARISCLVEKVL